eukprot:TRINITY_DN12522_c0_g1_i1.p1 TRINITY_DN12522_c0_g1~~TRINITY_DN12522_c0_g1_i1.p1  ORF type:complete len:118 (-),score=32.85 TRINITY_DN12522_c0_g1_i1:258-611(-)
MATIAVEQVQETDGSDRHTEFGIEYTAANGELKTTWRRFSQFKILYDALSLSTREDLKDFPHKSMFSTFSDKTVDRRQSFFDQMMKVILQEPVLFQDENTVKFLDPYFDFPTKIVKK